MKPVEILGKENVPEQGALVVPNALRAGELSQLESLFSQRRVAYLVEQGADYPAPMQDHFGRADVTTVYFTPFANDFSDVREAIAEVTGANGFVFFVPKPVQARSVTLTTVPSQTLSFLLGLAPAVLPLFVGHPREDVLQVENPRANPDTVFAFGPLLEGETLGVPAYIERLLGCNEEAYTRRAIFDGNLAHALVQGLRKHGSRARIIDGMDGSELRFDKLLAAAIALSKTIKEETTKPRVGIILPPGKAVFVANLAVLLAGKIPVNLNFTAGHKAVESAIRQADLDRFVTADPFVRKMQKFPWPPNRQLVFLERVLPHLKPKIVRWLLLSKLLPAHTLCRLLGIPTKGGRSEATLMFTSGSSGEPKGVVMSHHNLLSNVAQFSSRLGMRHDEKILGSLPLFHSFGCTVTMWFPIIEGHGVVTYPSPLDAGKLAPLIEEHGVSLVVATPTFLRGYMRKVKREQLASVRYIVSGAEKLPRQFAEAFAERFGKEILEGYGLTETSPVTNVNLPDPEDKTAGEVPVIPSARPGSVGQFVPGVAVRITDPDSNEALPVDRSGIIWLRGPNIFEGYLNNPKKTEEVLQDRWFRTGDIGHLDEDGFLYIEGRLSRFSKIGGEMVPHETVEAYINKAFNLDTEEERKIAVVGVPDPQKGEHLVLLSTVAGETISQELIELRYTLLDVGVPALWIPKKLIRVEEIPLLASGKLDLKRCEQIALQD